ncbi:prolyl endopeptidase FAP isoform X3 [Centrocercus urophasianus]|uniref:prolyl endopeptidase FAP isoform X3 n=1 Tax=Centrocercus urophasianus TaxID=9002 RepID=UPI001C65165B|nr:prolyl endopeptidase FAP isoform X3 [Centrocercus urophasianus]
MKTRLKVLFGVVVCVLLSLLLMCIVLLPSKVVTTADGPRALTLDDYLNGNFQYKTYFPYWVSDSEYLHQNPEDDIILFNVDMNYVTTIMTNSTMKQVNASNYVMSSDKYFIALESNYSKLWRYSYTASYHIYDLIYGGFVTENQLPHKIQYISWSPVGHKLAYVYQNNIYLKQSPREAPIQLTSDGKENEIFNGIPDWVYEEEMLATKYALWWSPSGKYLAYVQFNDSDIPVIEYSYFGEEQYPRKIIIPYPKAGAKNPTVKVFIVDTINIEAFGPKEVPVPAVITSSDHYFTWLTWVTDNRVGVQWLKRIQNFSVLAICDFKENSNTWVCPENQQHIEESQTGWAGGFFVSAPYFTSDSSSYYKIFSDKNGYKHIHYINGSVENAIQITSGEWEAIYIFRVTNDAIFYSSNEFEGYPGRRNIYKISTGSKPIRKLCITCNLRKERCQYYTARFSERSKYYALICYGPGIPISTLFENENDRELRILEDNQELQSALQEIILPKEEINKLEVDGITLWYKMLIPPQFDRSKKYPLLIQVYGGPCSQNVKHTFSISWITYLASKEGIIVALVDGRGTAYQGDKILHAVYRRLGVYEVEDQISAVKKFIEMGFIDEKRIAIWGWSYGGYVTSLALGSGSGVFKCGIAVAPVSSWEYYASIYTERFMGLPVESDNLEHYKWYTDQNHGIPGLSSKHLYTHMTHFLKQCFSLSE